MGSNEPRLWVPRNQALGSTNPGSGFQGTQLGSPGFVACAWVRRTQVQATNPGNLGSAWVCRTQIVWVRRTQIPWVRWTHALGSKAFKPGAGFNRTQALGSSTKK
ncbi:hypothetical protein SLEP1_g38564 [Rubroshorea leprosula]|nr:hypothetical protein SLEP1_g38564 [Rubroshorea leprosula]